MKGRFTLTEATKEKIKRLYKEGVSQPALSERFGVTQSYISMLCSEKKKGK